MSTLVYDVLFDHLQVVSCPRGNRFHKMLSSPFFLLFGFKMSHLLYSKITASIWCPILFYFSVEKWFRVHYVVNKLVMWETQFLWCNMLIWLYFTFTNNKPQWLLHCSRTTANGKKEKNQWKKMQHWQSYHKDKVKETSADDIRQTCIYFHYMWLLPRSLFWY